MSIYKPAHIPDCPDQDCIERAKAGGYLLTREQLGKALYYPAGGEHWDPMAEHAGEATDYLYADVNLEGVLRFLSRPNCRLDSTWGKAWLLSIRSAGVISRSASSMLIITRARLTPEL